MVTYGMLTRELSFEGCEGNGKKGVGWSREVKGAIQRCYNIGITPKLLKMSARTRQLYGNR